MTQLIVPGFHLYLQLSGNERMGRPELKVISLFKFAAAPVDAHGKFEGQSLGSSLVSPARFIWQELLEDSLGLSISVLGASFYRSYHLWSRMFRCEILSMFADDSVAIGCDIECQLNIT